MSIANEDSRKIREEVITAGLNKISKEQKITQDEKALQLLANHAVDEFQRQKSKIDLRRRTRLPFTRSANSVQKFVSTISEFLKAYSGLNEVAKGVDNQYGGLVTGALSVLVQIGENKEGREKAITSIFEELTKSWLGDAGRLSLYSDAYPTSSRMEGFLADVYLGIGELAVDSAEYYARPSYTRLWQAIRRPPKLGIDPKAGEIKKAILEVVSEANALHVHAYADQTKALEKIRTQKRNDQITKMATELGISWDIVDSDSMMAKCRALHANAFAESVRRKATKQLQQISLDLLKDQHLYISSEETTQSSAIVLSDLNFDGYDTGRDLCWLSPVTTEIAELYRSRQRSGDTSRLLFHSACRDEASKRSHRKEPFNICLSRFILQILLWDDDYFSRNRQKIKYDIRRSVRSKKEVLQDLLRGWTGSGEVCIVIDRLDRIAPPDDNSNTGGDEVTDLLETILEVVSTAFCKIRLVITIDTSGWINVRKDAHLEESWNIWKKRINLQRYSPFYKIDWQQREIQQW